MKAFSSVSNVFNDHLTVTLRLPSIAKAALVLTPRQVETTHVSVNSLRECPYCTLLHGELARMSGVPDVAGLMANKCEVKNGMTNEEVAIRAYAQSFGKDPAAAASNDMEALGKVLGSEAKAKSVDSLCWFLHWGSMSGNTINSLFGGETKSSLNILAKLIFVIYYTPLFLLIVIFGYALKIMPTSGPKFINAILGVALAFIAGTFILPLGILGIPLRLLGL